MTTEALIIDYIIMLSNRVVYVVELLTLLESLREHGQSAEDVARTLGDMYRMHKIRYYETKFGLLIGLTGGNVDDAVLSWISTFLPTHRDLLSWYEEG